MSVWEAETQTAIARYEAEVRATGLGDVWDHLLAQEPSASRSLLLGTVGALGAYLAETGFRITDAPAVT